VSLGPAEILVLAVVVLVFMGPRRLPEAARHRGPAWRDPCRDLADVMVTVVGADVTPEGSA
jgi:Sec-independent protein translocase protein TatA